LMQGKQRMPWSNEPWNAYPASSSAAADFAGRLGA
jgi:hypothetical protein